MKFKISLAAIAFAVSLCISAPYAGATTYINDDFSTFAPGALVGQNGWVQNLASATLPLQVSGGNVVIPDNQTADNQDASKSLGSTITSTIYSGMSLNLTSAPTTGTTYFFALLESSGGFANARIAAIDNSANIANTYFLETRYTGQGGNPFVAGTIPLSYNQTYNVVQKTIITNDGSGEAVVLYVNPTDNIEANQTPYATQTATIGQLIPPVGITAVTISQFANTTTSHNSGVKIDHVFVADNFAAAAAVPEPSTMILAGLSLLGLIAAKKARRS